MFLLGLAGSGVKMFRHVKFFYGMESKPSGTELLASALGLRGRIVSSSSSASKLGMY